MAARKKAKKAPETFHFEERETAMGRAEEMRNLCQEIPASFDARMQWVADLKRQTVELMNGILARQRERIRETAEMLKGFRREQEAMAGHWQDMVATIERKRASAA